MIVSSADWSLQCCFRAFLDPLLNLRFISDFLVQSSKARAIFQHVWRIQLAFINVWVVEREEADVRKAQLKPKMIKWLLCMKPLNNYLYGKKNSEQVHKVCL